MAEDDSYEKKKTNEHSNSFINRITSRVSGILPQPISQWLIPSELQKSTDSDDEDEERLEPSKKRPHLESSSRQNHINRLGFESGDISPILRNRTDHDPAIPGPSGLSKKTTLVFSTPAPENLKINGGDESDSESTSGCSSLVPQGEKVTGSNYIVQRKTSMPLSTPTKVSSQTTSPTSRRLPNPRPSNFTKLDLSSSKRPRFDSHVFHNSSLNKSLNASRTSLNDSLSSPFYKGRTMYGGASSYKEVLNVPLGSSKGGITRKVSVKPSLPTNASNERIGTAAARILKALEQFAAPVPEKKKPVGKSRSETRRRFQPYQELVIPQVPDLLRIKRKEKPLPPPPPETSDVVDQAQPVETLSERLSAPAEESFVGCIRGRKNEHLETEKAKPLILPNVKLPITTLPNFTFTGLPKVSPSPKLSNPPVLEKKSSPPPIPSTKVPSKPLSQYTFSKPIVESSDGHSVPSISPTFRFSEPLDANANEKIPNKMIPKNELKPKPELSKKVESSSNGFGEMFKAPKGGWECTTCLVNNSADKQKCAACETPKVAPPKQLVISTPDKWECKKCKLNNFENDKNCKSCGADKNGVVNAPLAKGFEEFLKKKTDSWECQECFVSNKNSDVSCVACSKAKPGAAPVVSSVASTVSTSSVSSVSLTSTPSSTSVPLTSLFKKPEGNWECGICMVSNKSDVDACVACATPKPGAKVEKPAVTFQFGIPNSTEAVETPKTSGFTFGIPDAKVETKEPQFIATEFKFGIPSENEKKDEKPSKRVSFGNPLVNEKIIPEPEVTFSFGNTDKVDTPQKQEENKPNEIKTNSLFQFGSSVTSEKLSSEKPNIFGNLNSTDNKNDKNELSFGSFNKTEVKPVEPPKNTFNEEPKKSIFGVTPSFGENNVFGKKEPENVFGKESHVFAQKDAFNAEKPNSVFGNDKIGSNSLEFNKKPDENKVFAFGKANSVVTENSVFNKTNADAFPSSSQKDEKVFAFGSRPQTNFFNNDKSVFGNKIENSEPKPVPTFGNAVNSTENKPFAFNSSQGFNYFNKEEKQNSGGFNFNAPQQNAFAFGSAPAQTPSFTNPTPVQPSTFAFGSTHQEPQQQNMFGFQGQATTTPFAFGQNSLNQHPPQPPVQQPQVQPPVFDPNVKPNFNFSGGATPLFSATPSVPSTGEAEPRKIRKAIRRFR